MSYENHPVLRWDRTVFYLGLIALLALTPLVMYNAYRGALSGLSGALSRGTGLAVAVDDLWVTPGPSLVLHKVRVGSPGLELSVDRLVLELDLKQVFGLFSGGKSRRTMVRGVRVQRPRLRVTSAGLTQLATAASPAKASPKEPAKEQKPAPAKPRTASPDSSSPTQVVIEDGALSLELGQAGQGLSLSSQGIYLDQRGEGRRLLMGKTTLHAGGKSLLDLPSAALDLPPSGGGVLPVRLAAAGGQLDLLDHTFDVHLFHLTRKPSGYRVAIKGAARDANAEQPGRFSLEARLDALHRPTSVRAALLQLENLNLERLFPLLRLEGVSAPNTRVSGKLRLWREANLARVQLQLSGETITVSHPLLARRPVGPFPAKLLAELTLDPRGRAITLSRLDLTSGKLTARLQGELSLLDNATRLAVDLELPATDCQTLLTSIPDGFAPTLKGAYLKGELGARGRLRLVTDKLEEAEVDLTLTPLTCRMLVDPPGADVNKLAAPITVKVPGPAGTTKPWRLGPENLDYLPFARLGRHIKAAFVAGEDNRFHWHNGFDVKQLRRAFIANVKAGRAVRGASTISQQLIKNVFLHHGRTLSRKAQEAVLTWRLEQRVSKERILELYLNVVEMGVNLRGVAQGAGHYFDKPPWELTPLEAAHLAAITPFPRRPADMLDSDGHATPSWMERLHQLIRIMRRTRHLNEADVQRWCNSPLRLKRGPG